MPFPPQNYLLSFMQIAPSLSTSPQNPEPSWRVVFLKSLNNPFLLDAENHLWFQFPLKWLNKAPSWENTLRGVWSGFLSSATQTRKPKFQDVSECAQCALTSLTSEGLIANLWMCVPLLGALKLCSISSTACWGFDLAAAKNLTEVNA